MYDFDENDNFNSIDENQEFEMDFNTFENDDNLGLDGVQ
jgi:hypothetical protein